MKVNITQQVSPYLVFFVIYNSQVGVGILSFQRKIAEKAGYDGWIGVLIAGCLVQVLIWVMYKLLGKVNGDIIDVHNAAFGKNIGKVLSFIILLCYILPCISVLMEYIEIIQVWMFPNVPSWVISTLILLLVYYCVSGGFRAVVGLSFLSFIFPQIFVLILYIFPLKDAHFSNLLPIMNHSLPDMLHSIKNSLYVIYGTEALLMFYPFIQNPDRSRKFAHLGVLFTTFLYTVSAIVSFTFYSEGQLQTSVWPELSLTKIINFSFLERFEYLYISMYLIIVTALISLLLWCSSRGFKKIFNIKQQHALLIISIVCIFTSQLNNQQFRVMLDKFITPFNGYVVYVYIPLLLLYFTLFKRGHKSG